MRMLGCLGWTTRHCSQCSLGEGEEEQIIITHLATILGKYKTTHFLDENEIQTEKVTFGRWLRCSWRSRTLIQSSKHQVYCCLCGGQSTFLERSAGTSAEFHSFCWTSFTVSPRHVPMHSEDPPLALTLHRPTNHFLWKINKNNLIRKYWLFSFRNIDVNKNTAMRKCILQKNHFCSPESSGKVWGNHCYVASPDT